MDIHIDPTAVSHKAKLLIGELVLQIAQLQAENDALRQALAELERTRERRPPHGVDG
jgi:hypothetical protein